MRRATTTIALLLCASLCTGSNAAEDNHARYATDAIETLINNAHPDDTVVVPAGTYEGQLKIKHPVSLDGAGHVVIEGPGKGTVVEISSPDVTFRGFTVRGSGSGISGEPAAIRVMAANAVIENNHIEDALFGIDLRNAQDCTVRGNTIRGKDLEPGRRGDGIRLWWSHNCTVEDNEVRGSRDMVFWYSENLRITNNSVSNSRYGLHFMYSHNTVLDRNVLEGNSVGVYLMYSNAIRLTHNTMTNNRGASGYGIGLKDCDDIIVENNALLANRVGLYVDNSPSSVDSIGLIASNMIAYNEIGLLATPNTHDNVLTTNAFIENEEQAATHGRGDLSANTFYKDNAGNFWSDYAGYDLDKDGTGDLPYQPQSLFASMLAKEPNLRLFVHSPAQQAVELASRAFPELRPAPTLVDPMPLATPPALAATPRAGNANKWPLALFGAGLLAAAGVSCTCFARTGTVPAALPRAQKGAAA